MAETKKPKLEEDAHELPEWSVAARLEAMELRMDELHRFVRKQMARVTAQERRDRQPCPDNGTVDPRQLDIEGDINEQIRKGTYGLRRNAAG